MDESLISLTKPSIRKVVFIIMMFDFETSRFLSLCFAINCISNCLLRLFGSSTQRVKHLFNDRMMILKASLTIGYL